MTVDGHEIHAMSRSEAESYIGTEPYVIVSISDTSKPLPVFSDDPYRLDILRLAFNDFVELVDFEAARVWEFVQRYWNDVKVVICHCEMGVSRSPAIAAAITKAKGGEEKQWFVNRLPNKLVYYKMLEAIYDAKRK